MSGEAAAYVILALVVVQRLGELVLAQRNTKALLARGAVEIGRRHYPLIVALHASWLIAIVWFLPIPPRSTGGWLRSSWCCRACASGCWPRWGLTGPPGLSRCRARLWSSADLTVLSAIPNYLVVAGEILVLPLVFGETGVAVFFSIANAAMLAWRIRQEETGLATRRGN